eukprot:scaffold51559_cov31-Tisochrysis_lutea.AAC.5
MRAARRCERVHGPMHRGYRQRLPPGLRMGTRGPIQTRPGWPTRAQCDRASQSARSSPRPGHSRRCVPWQG